MPKTPTRSTTQNWHPLIGLSILWADQEGLTVTRPSKSSKTALRRRHSTDLRLMGPHRGGLLPALTDWSHGSGSSQMFIGPPDQRVEKGHVEGLEGQNPSEVSGSPTLSRKMTGLPLPDPEADRAALPLRLPPPRRDSGHRPASTHEAKVPEDAARPTSQVIKAIVDQGIFSN